MVVIKGYIYVVDMFDCAEIPNGESLRQVAIGAVNDAGMREVQFMYGHFSQHVYKADHGDSVVTLIIPLEESHLAIHTWPDQRLVCVDLFTCGDVRKAEQAVENLIAVFKPARKRMKGLKRG